MSRGWKFQSGDWNFTCDSCGQKKKASVGKLRWDGFRVCSDCFEMRHPQDFLRARIDNQSVPWSRPKLQEVFLQGNFTATLVNDVPLFEDIITAAQYYRYIGTVTYPEDQDVVNGKLLNFSVLNYSSVDPPAPPNEEEFSLSEAVVVSHGYGIIVNDTLTLSENISENENEFPADSLGISESVSYYITTNRILNAHLINEVILG